MNRQSRNITDMLYIINTSSNFKGRDITLTTLEEYNKKYNCISKKYTITIWSKKKRERTENDKPAKWKRIIQNIPEQHVFYKQVEVLMFLSELVNEIGA